MGWVRIAEVAQTVAAEQASGPALPAIAEPHLQEVAVEEGQSSAPTEHIEAVEEESSVLEEDTRPAVRPAEAK